MKNTSSLIPLCHNINLTKCKVIIKENGEKELRVISKVKSEGKTGVEMEALVGAAIASCAVVDMVKGYDKGVVVSEVKVVEKTGGKNEDLSVHGWWSEEGGDGWKER